MLHREPLPDGRTTIVFTLPPNDPPGEVSLVGSFNDWTPGEHPMRAQQDGTRSVSVTLDPGEHHFRYLATDGIWEDDPDADQIAETGSVVQCNAPAGVGTRTDQPSIPGQANAPETRMATDSVETGTPMQSS